MMKQENFDALLADAERANFSGWDFGYLHGRLIELLHHLIEKAVRPAFAAIGHARRLRLAGLLVEGERLSVALLFELRIGF